MSCPLVEMLELQDSATEVGLMFTCRPPRLYSFLLLVDMTRIGNVRSSVEYSCISSITAVDEMFMLRRLATI